MNTIRRRSGLLVIAAMGLAACTTAADLLPIRQYGEAPRPALQQRRPMGIARMVNRVPMGTHIGTLQGGAFCIGGERMQERGGGGSDLQSDRVFLVVRDELKAAGFQFPGDDGSLFPGPQQWQPDLLLAGAMVKRAMNACLPKVGFGNRRYSSGEVSLEVEWQVFDRTASGVVLTTTGGWGRREAMDYGLDEAHYAALAMSVRNLVATPEFAQVTRPALTGLLPRR